LLKERDGYSSRIGPDKTKTRPETAKPSGLSDGKVDVVIATRSNVIRSRQAGRERTKAGNQ
jgi:hypothetical protein